MDEYSFTSHPKGFLIAKDNEGHSFAVKTLPVLPSSSPEIRRRIAVEIAVHKLVSSFPGCLPLLNVYEKDNCYYVFTPLMEKDLFDCVPTPQAFDYLQELLDTVDALHAIGIVHRDIKPENILVHDRLYLADFGCSTHFKLNNQARVLSTVCGSLHYMAPEIFTRSYKGPPVDIWSLGIVFYAMLYGQLPWEMALPDCPEYRDYLRIRRFPKVDDFTNHILQAMLDPNALKRATIPAIKSLLRPQIQSFSQPTIRKFSQDSDLFINQSQQPALSLCRFYSPNPESEIMASLISTLTALCVPFHQSQTSVSFETLDSRRFPLKGIISMKACGHLNSMTVAKTCGNPDEFLNLFKILISSLDIQILK